MRIDFITYSELSPLDLFSMGDSSKRGKPNKIGQFDSGLKYAIAILLRNGVELIINTCEKKTGNMHEFTFGIDTEKCEYTDKQKELIVIHHKYLNKTEEIRTGFALQLGFNWELWMAFRELYSNMVDESGFMVEDPNGDLCGPGNTRMMLHFEEDSPFHNVIINKSRYIWTDRSAYYSLGNVHVFESFDGFLRIYKKTILVYENLEIKCFYNFNIEFGELDERRTLLDFQKELGTIFNKMLDTNNENFIGHLLTNGGKFQEGDILQQKVYFGSVNDKMCEVANSLGDKLNTYESVLKAIKQNKNCELPGRIIRSISDSLWTYSKEVAVSPATEEVVFSDIKELIESKYNLKIEAEIIVCYLEGQPAIADKAKKAILVHENFDVEKDMPHFMVEYISLTQKGNVLLNLARKLLERLKIERSITAESS